MERTATAVLVTEDKGGGNHLQQYGDKCSAWKPRPVAVCLQRWQRCGLGCRCAVGGGWRVAHGWPRRWPNAVKCGCRGSSGGAAPLEQVGQHGGGHGGGDRPPQAPTAQRLVRFQRFLRPLRKNVCKPFFLFISTPLSAWLRGHPEGLWR